MSTHERLKSDYSLTITIAQHLHDIVLFLVYNGLHCRPYPVSHCRDGYNGALRCMYSLTPSTAADEVIGGMLYYLPVVS